MLLEERCEALRDFLGVAAAGAEGGPADGGDVRVDRQEFRVGGVLARLAQPAPDFHQLPGIGSGSLELGSRNVFRVERGIESGRDGVLQPAHEGLWLVGQPPGLDGWAGLDYNWVVIAADSDMTAGGHVRGSFQFVMDGITSTSRYFLNGTFEVDHIKKDHWVNEDLQGMQLSNGAEVSCFDKD